jgi:hypothetical protein
VHQRVCITSSRTPRACTRRKNFGPLVVALLTVQLLIALWAAWRIDDVFWQLRRTDTLSKLVVRSQGFLSGSTIRASVVAPG